MIAQNIFNRFDASVDIYQKKKASPQLHRAYLAFKLILLICNLVFLIFGCVLIGVGSYALNVHVGALSGQTLPAGLVVMGVFTMFLSLLGGISAWRESRVGLGIYLSFLCIIAIIIFSVGIAVYVKRNQSTDYMVQGWRSVNNDIRVTIQNDFDCCGLYLINGNFTDIGSPCPNTIYGRNRPCLALLQDAFSGVMTKAGGVGIAFGILMGAVIILVSCLIDGIRKRQMQADVEEIGNTISNAGAEHQEPEEDPRGSF